MASIKQQLSTTAGFDLETVMIRLYQHSWCPFTHVDAIMPDGRLLGARTDGGVQSRAPDYEKWSHTVIVELPCSDAVEQAYYAFLLDQIGKPYDLEAIAHMAILNVDPALPRPTRNWRETDSWFCSELDLAAKEQSGFFANPLVVPSIVMTPADDLLLASGFCDVFERMKLVGLS